MPGQHKLDFSMFMTQVCGVISKSLTVMFWKVTENSDKSFYKCLRIHVASIVNNSKGGDPFLAQSICLLSRNV